MSQPHNDDDGTVIRSGPTVPTGSTAWDQVIGAPPTADAGDGLSLRVGTRVAEFEVIERIGEGGFSIVYLAMDHSLERTVALKEYMPSSLAGRVGTTQVQPRSQRHRDTFEAGLKSFVNEAKLLAQFDHPALVKVYRFWEANGTAYMVMPFYQGVTVKDAVRALPTPPDEAWLMTLLAPLTEALMVIHSQHCFHRDIAPDNVILLAGSGKPLLLDFGAARRVIGDMTQALTVILKSGYAPVEQYAEVPGMKQGPWTDVYALAAVLHWAITGKTPPPSVGRMVSDSYVPLAEHAAGRYSLKFLQAIDCALLVLPDRRTQSIEAFRLELGLGTKFAPSEPQEVEWRDPDVTIIRPPPSGPDARASFVGTRQPGGSTHAESGLRLSKASPHDVAPRHLPTEAGPGPPTEAAKSHRSTRTMLAASVLGVGLLATAAWWAMQGPGFEASTAVPAPASPVLPPLAGEATGNKGEAATTSPLPSPPATTPQAEAKPEAAVHAAPADARPQPEPPSSAQSQTAPFTQAQRAETKQTRPKREEAKPEAGQPASANSAECARILQKLSLGETSAELVDRLKALNCR